MQMSDYEEKTQVIVGRIPYDIRLILKEIGFMKFWCAYVELPDVEGSHFANETYYDAKTKRHGVDTAHLNNDGMPLAEKKEDAIRQIIDVIKEAKGIEEEADNEN